MALICAASQAAQAQVAIYDANPEHLWNRRYRAMAVRTEDGTQYGVDNSEPYHEPFDDPKQLTLALDKFLDHHGERRASDDLRRALLLNDVWAAFDLAVSSQHRMTAAGFVRALLRARRA